MKEKINTYFAVLLITVAGSGAALIVIHVATTDAANTALHGSEDSYAALRQSILDAR